VWLHSFSLVHIWFCYANFLSYPSSLLILFPGLLQILEMSTGMVWIGNVTHSLMWWSLVPSLQIHHWGVTGPWELCLRQWLIHGIIDGSGNFQRWGLSEEVGFWRQTGSWGSILSQAPPSAPLCMLHARVSTSFLYSLCHDALPYQTPELTEPANHRIKPLKPGAEINLSSFQIVSLRYLSQQTKS
jgi:hypothetical protein